MLSVKKLIIVATSVFVPIRTGYCERQNDVTVGVATVLTGDADIIGTNIQKTIATYEKRHLRHPIKFIFEDAKKGSTDGLLAYKRLVEVSKVDLLIGGTTSNGTMAGAPIINQSKTPLITPLTGGSNIDNAGEYIFRIGNSDILNGYQQADLFISRGLKRVALLTEQTEYTSDIAKYFKERFLAKGGVLSTEDEFLPDTTDFRSQILKIRSKEPQALFMSTQSGLAFGLFIKQFRTLTADPGVEIHTNFLSADNPEARTVAGDTLYGVHYFAPSFDRESSRLKEFFAEFQIDHKSPPAIAFHTAGTVDALNMLQDYLDGVESFSAEGFREYLLNKVKNYKGLMGQYSFDAKGNADIGFEPAVIVKAS